MTSHLGRALALGLGLIACGATPARAASVAQTTLQHVDSLRTIVPSDKPEDNARNNRLMDEAWTFYKANLKEALPVLRGALEAETKSATANQLVLLDVGWFLYLNDASARPLALRALYLIDAKSEIIRFNHQQLFEFTHQAARDHADGLLEFIDRAFLPNDQHMFVPAHAMDLGPTLICAFLYGAYGPEAEEHLAKRLAAHVDDSRTLELLAWLGSADSVKAVAPSLDGPASEPIYKRVLTFMMMVGGPEGRRTMLALDPAKLAPAARELHAKLRKNIEGQNFAVLRGQLESLPGDQSMSDAELKSRLDAMYANFGKDEDTSPLAVLDSKLPRAALLAQLKQIRGRMFHRLSNEALDDVEVTNLLINALQYRPD